MKLFASTECDEEAGSGQQKSISLLSWMGSYSAGVIVIPGQAGNETVGERIFP